jgi:hypothetical protein
MSLTAALRPAALSFAGASPNRGSQGETARPFHHEPSYINLNRMLIRYQHLILLTPDPTSEQDAGLTPLQRQIQADLWSPLPFHRTKWLHNIDGARSLLLQLERAAQSLRVQRTKQNALKDLAEKRIVIKRLRNKIEEIGREVEAMGEDAYNYPRFEDDRETALDVLRQQRRKSGVSPAHEETLQNGKPVTQVEEVGDGDLATEDTSRDALFSTSSNIRKRGQQDANTPNDTGETTGYRKLDAAEQAMFEASSTHEDLTQSLVSMAAQLKQQTRAFQFSLDQDKGLLDKAVEGLDINLTGMEAARKNMAFLTRMSEEQGLFGRLKLYAMIFAMWILAILLVFVGPKLRF